MPTSARVVVLPSKQGPLRVEDLSLPDPGPTQVIVKQYASGICHSQLHQMHRPRTAPVVLGHESTGIVMKTGSAVSHVKEGDTVMVTWVPRNAAKANHVPMTAPLTTSDGTAIANVFTWADITIADEVFVVKVPDHIARDVTSIVGCAVMTGAGAVINTAQVKKGESVAVFGVGGVGLSAVAAAKMVEANPIIAVDLDDAKLAFAMRFGATHGVNAAREDPIKAIHAITNRSHVRTIRGDNVTGADYAFDCIGAQKTMEQIIPAVRRGRLGHDHGGTAVLVGIPQTQLQIDPGEVVGGEKRFIGSLGGSCTPDADFPLFVKWFEDGHLDLNAMVTARYSIDQINDATAALEQGKTAGRSILVF